MWFSRHFPGWMVVGLALLFTSAAWAQSSYKILYSFPGGLDGGGPEGALTFDAQGNLYGTAVVGGDADCGVNGGCGVVFELMPQQNGSWSESVLYSFQGKQTHPTDGWNANTGAIFDTTGNLYGATYDGGPNGGGTIFELTPGSTGWTEKVLYGFGAHANGGFNPWARPIIDAAGNLYGTTYEGGDYDGGVVYKFVPGSSKNVIIHQFCPTNCADGRTPTTPVTMDAAGNLYGTTGAGGLYPPTGVVFEFTPSADGGWKKKVLHTFGKYADDGVNPSSGVLFDPAGNIYVVTSGGGTNRCGPLNGTCGAVVQMTPTAEGRWKERVIHNFASGSGGYFPHGDLVMDKAGNLYGETSLGGDSSTCPYGCGTLYELSPSVTGEWKYTLLHTFETQTGDGSSGGMIMDAAGNLYGTASLDGPGKEGVVFELTP
jgi:uncharacterized repeat protein (TIGR03803 family)